MLFLFILIFFIAIFRPWFALSGTLSAGDWPYLFREQIQQFSWLPESRLLWLAPYYQLGTKIVVQYLGLPWNIAERVLWFWPWIAISFFSARKFTKSSLGGLVYTTNTYALMLVGGGQMGVAMAYAFAPLVFVNAWFFPIQLMFDPRIALLTILAIAAYRLVIDKQIFKLLIPVVAGLALNSFWIISLLRRPALVGVQIKEATEAAVRFLSFASFSNALGLLHPNWPENIFGKIYFLRPEFLIIPIIAFTSLLFSNKKIVFFSLLSLFGAFLAKGANGPFAFVYPALFAFIPGFQAFRDPTKFYLFIALGYSVLIPFALARLAERFHIGKLLPFVFLLFWGLTLREAVTGKLGGTFIPVEVPKEYLLLKDPATAWYPKKSRFSYSGGDFVSLENVRYVAIPVDVRGEIFVTEGKYDAQKRTEAIEYIATMSGLRRREEFRDLAVFEKL